MPETFLFFLDQSNEYGKDGEDPILTFYRRTAYPLELRPIISTLIKSGVIQRFDTSSKEAEKYGWVLEALINEFKTFSPPMRLLVNILFEEYVFLQENSWIVFRIKKPFNTFINVGNVCLQFSINEFEFLARKTLKKKSDELLNRMDMLRAFGKWIAVAGFPFTPLSSIPLFVAITSSFLLIDP